MDKVYTRVLLAVEIEDSAASNAEIEQILMTLGYSFTCKPHPKGGLAVNISKDQLGDLDEFLERTTGAGLIHVL